MICYVYPSCPMSWMLANICLKNHPGLCEYIIHEKRSRSKGMCMEDALRCSKVTF